MLKKTQRLIFFFFCDSGIWKIVVHMRGWILQMPFNTGTTEEETLCKENIWNNVIRAKAYIGVHKGINIQIRRGTYNIWKGQYIHLYLVFLWSKSNLYFDTFPGMTRRKTSLFPKWLQILYLIHLKILETWLELLGEELIIFIITGFSLLKWIY